MQWWFCRTHYFNQKYIITCDGVALNTDNVCSDNSSNFNNNNNDNDIDNDDNNIITMPAVRRHGRGVHRRPVRYRGPVVAVDVTSVVVSSAIGGRVKTLTAAATAVAAVGGGGGSTLDVLCSGTEFGPIAWWLFRRVHMQWRFDWLQKH